jgi:hypothetical protein
MDALQQFLKKLDKSNYDITNVNTINSEFQKLYTLLFEEGKTELAVLADLNRQVFGVQKSFETKLDTDKGTINGLSWQMSGTQTLEDGSQIPLYWPDVTKLTQQDFEYFEKRYKECSNLFVKTEYGLMVYFGEKTPYSKHRDFKKQFCNELYSLSKDYLTKSLREGAKNHYCMDFIRTIKMAFIIAEKASIEPEITDLATTIYKTHQEWDTSKDGTLRILLDLSGIMSEYYGLFSKRIDFQKVLDKNIAGALELEKKHIWGAIYAVDLNISIEQKRKRPANLLLAYKAKLFEKLLVEAESNSNLACVGFAEDALRIYQQLKDNENIDRLEKTYNDLRGKFKLSEIRQELPKEHTTRISEIILKTITDSDEMGIISHFIITPWYDKIKAIKERSVELRNQSVFLSMLPTSIMDKFGNTIDVFRTDEEKELFSFWNTYTFNFQIGTQTMHQFFIEAYKAGKLSYTGVRTYLEQTWFNEKIVRSYHGRTIEVIPLDTLKPGLKKLFNELDNYSSDNTYGCDFVTITDSLTLKVEGLLRYFCEKNGISTFKTRQKGSEKLVMEKLIDDLLADIAHKPPFNPEQETFFDEEDRIFIKYVMSEKAGLNLRNMVAHSLMDIFEYSFENIVVLFSIILKLSKYKFVEIKRGDNDEDSSK